MSGYSGINTARSALSAVIWNGSRVTIGKFLSVKRFMKRVFENLPALPRYSAAWDVDIALEFLKKIYPDSESTLMELSHKLVILLA